LRAFIYFFFKSKNDEGVFALAGFFSLLFSSHCHWKYRFNVTKEINDQVCLFLVANVLQILHTTIKLASSVACLAA
jgi:hypothetical protein